MDSSPRNLGEKMTIATVKDTVRPALFVFADFPDAPVRTWSGIGTLSWDGHEWLGTGSLLAIEDITETTDSAQNGLAVQLSGVPSYIMDATLLANYQNRRITVWLGFFNDNMELIDDPYQFFSGFMDSDEVHDDGATCTIKINAESELGDQLKALIYRYSFEDQQLLYPTANDRGYEFVAALVDVDIPWGRQS